MRRMTEFQPILLAQDAVMAGVVCLCSAAALAAIRASARRRAYATIHSDTAVVSQRKFHDVMKQARTLARQPSEFRPLADFIVKHDVRSEDAMTVLQAYFESRTPQKEEASIAAYLARRYLDHGLQDEARRVLDFLTVNDMADQEDLDLRARMVIDETDVSPFARSICEQAATHSPDQTLQSAATEYLTRYYLIAVSCIGAATPETEELLTKALEELERARQRTPGDRRLYVGMARGLSLLGKSAECHEDCTKASKIFGDSYLQSVSEYWADSLLKVHGHSVFAAASVSAAAKSSGLTVQGFSQVFSAASEDHPKADYMRVLAALAASMGRTDQAAMELYEAAVTRGSDDDAILGILAEWYRKEERWDDALGIGRTLLAAAPSDEGRRRFVAEALLARGCSITDEEHEFLRGFVNQYAADRRYRELALQATMRKVTATDQDVLFAASLEPVLGADEKVDEVRGFVLSHAMADSNHCGLSPDRLLGVFGRWWEGGGRDKHTIDPAVEYLCANDPKHPLLIPVIEWMAAQGPVDKRFCGILLDAYNRRTQTDAPVAEGAKLRGISIRSRSAKLGSTQVSAESVAAIVEKSWKQSETFDRYDVKLFDLVRANGLRPSKGAYEKAIRFLVTAKDHKAAAPLFDEYLANDYYEEEFIKETLSCRAIKADARLTARSLSALVNHGHDVIRSGLELIRMNAKGGSSALDDTGVRQQLLESFGWDDTTEDQRRQVWEEVFREELLKKKADSLIPQEHRMLLWAVDNGLLPLATGGNHTSWQSMCWGLVKKKDRKAMDLATKLLSSGAMPPDLAFATLEMSSKSKGDPVEELALTAFDQFPSSRLVRVPLLARLSDRETWGKDDCSLATMLLSTGAEQELVKDYLKKVPYGRDKTWDGHVERLLTSSPELCESDARLQEIFVAVLLRNGDTGKALRLLDALLDKSEGAKRDEFVLRILDLLPQVKERDKAVKRAAKLLPMCTDNLRLASRLKDIVLELRVPARMALDVLQAWDTCLQEAWRSGDMSVSGPQVFEARHMLLRNAIEAKAHDDVREILSYCEHLDNLPPGIDAEEAVNRVMGFFNEALKEMGESQALLSQFGDFCVVRHRYPEALQSYTAFIDAGASAAQTKERLEKLIASIKELGAGMFLSTYLQAYSRLGDILRGQNVEEAVAKLGEVKSFFFDVKDSGSTTQQLVDPEKLEAPEQIRALRVLYLGMLEDISRKHPDDHAVLNELGTLAYHLRLWKRAGDAYLHLAILRIGTNTDKSETERLMNKLFWSHYCQGSVYRASMLQALDGFLERQRYDGGSDVGYLREYCALGYHELALGQQSMPEPLARKYFRKAERYYDDLMRDGLTPLQRPYLQELLQMLHRHDRTKAPFQYLKYDYQGTVPYELPLEHEEDPFLGEDPDIEKVIPMQVVSGFGEVFKVLRKAGSRSEYRAIKTLKRNIPGEDMEKVKRRFENEIRIMRELRHPNIVRFYRASCSQGRQYIEMEFVEGSDLQTLIEQKGRTTSLASRLEIFLKVCAGVQYLHTFGKGIVHCDLHPRNILTGGKNSEVVKVTDFGLAAVLDDEAINKSSRVRGRTNYVPPEVQRGQPFTRKGDVFSLGRILTFVLVGWPAADRHALVKEGGEGLADVCARCTADDPDGRYETVGALMADIASVLKDMPQVAADVDEGLKRIEHKMTLYELQTAFAPTRGVTFPTMEDIERADLLRVDAVDSESRNDVTVKFINAMRLDRGLEILHRIESLQHIASIEHPNVESIVRFGPLTSSAPYFYIVGTRLPEWSLFQLLELARKTEGSSGTVLIPLPFCLQVGCQIAAALTAVHKEGIFHRMVSPAKVLVSVEQNRCLLADFSVAVLKDNQRIQQTARQFGELEYLAPESSEKRFGPVDAKTDVYGLAKTLIAAVSGNLQKDYFNSQADIQALADRHRVALKDADSLSETLNRAAAHEKEQRPFANAGAFGSALRDLAKGMGIGIDMPDWRNIGNELIAKR